MFCGWSAGVNQPKTLTRNKLSRRKNGETL